MKRCPQCEFIYEDDQSLCDMDGVLLVFDSRTLPNLHALATVATVSGPLPEKGPRRSRMVPAFATLIMMLAVGSVYYVSTVRNVRPPDFTPPSVNVTVPGNPAVVPPAPTPATEETPKEEPRETHSSPAPVTKPAAEPPRKATTTNAAPAKPDTQKKDDSKVESILKKTGKILKKPFKF
jgi:hypothetical protein